MQTNAIAVLCSLGMLLFSANALACRCAEQTLEQYYRHSDLVFVATLTGAELAAADSPSASPLSGYQLLTFSDVDRYFKAPTNATPEAAAAAKFATATSTAQCGLEIRVGTRYIVFASLDPSRPGTALVDSCSGARPVSGEFARGFSDTPLAQLTQQLDAIAAGDILHAITALQPAEDDPQNETMIGLVTLESLDQGLPITTYQRPDADETIPADDPRIVHYPDELISREISTETPAAEVYARVDGWLKVHRQGLGFRWLPEAESGLFWPYDSLPIRRLSYLNSDWDGYIWPEPGAGLPWFAKGSDSGEQAVIVYESQRIGNSLWFKVELQSESPCEGIESPRTLAAGWVPAYGRSGKPAVWFYSRGC